MSASLSAPSAVGTSQSSFGRAAVIAVALEGLIFAALLLLARPDAQTTVGLRKKPMAVHLVTLPRPTPPVVVPKPPPRPVPKPKVRPLPKPVPRPRPPAVIHHRPVPLPRPVPPAPPKPVRLSPPRPVVPPPSPLIVAQAIDRYAVLLRTRIQARLVVPARIAALGLSGKALVAFALTPGGRLLWARVVHSSGITLIDRAALAAVRDRRYPPFTKTMPHHPVIFRVRVGLNDRRGRF